MKVDISKDKLLEFEMIVKIRGLGWNKCFFVKLFYWFFEFNLWIKVNEVKF